MALERELARVLVAAEDGDGPVLLSRDTDMRAVGAQCFATPVLKVYVFNLSSPRRSRKRDFGTMRRRYDVIEQIEQLHSSASTSSGASTSN